MKRAQVRAQYVPRDHTGYAEKDVLAEARLVIAHARRALQRGRQPSMAYKGQFNPRRALELALAEFGATIAELHTVELREVPIPVSFAQRWLRPAREWVHRMRLALRELAIPCAVPTPLDNRAVVTLLPQLMDIAEDLGLPMPGLRRLPPRIRWFDASDPAPYMRNELPPFRVRQFFRPTLT